MKEITSVVVRFGFGEALVAENGEIFLVS